MKKNYRTKLTFLLFFLCGVTGMAAPPVFEVSGTVSDKISGKYIVNAKIYLVRNGEIIIETSSNAQGNFVLKIAENDLEKGSIKVKVRKTGYRTELINTAPGLNNQLNIEMVRTKTVPIMVPKKSPTGQYIIVHSKALFQKTQHKSIWV